MKDSSYSSVTEQTNDVNLGDSKADAIAAVVLVLCIVAMAIIWVQGH